MSIRDTPGPNPSKPSYTDMGAVLSDDREYRYQLSRIWDEDKPVAGFVMVNPSTADATQDDRTITRCVKYANGMGFGKLVVANLFAVRSSDPSVIKQHPHPVGPKNDEHLKTASKEAERLFAGWGTPGGQYERAREVVKLLDEPLYALETTKQGHPCHPSRTPYDITVKPFSYDM